MKLQTSWDQVFLPLKEENNFAFLYVVFTFSILVLQLNVVTPEVFTSVINSYLPEPHASLLNGIIFGTSLRTSRALYEQLQAAGLLHIVVLSGMNISILAAMAAATTASLGKKASLVLTFFAIIIFIIFVGPKAPIVRAGFMGVLTVVAVLLGKRNIALYSLFLSAVAIALFQPAWLSTISFQLSYGATLGIILFGRAPQSRIENMLQRIEYGIRTELRVCLAASLFAAPIIFFYFRQISLVAPLSNVLVAPVIAPLMVFGFATAVLGKIHFALGVVPSYICFGLLSYLLAVVRITSSLPFAFFSF